MLIPGAVCETPTIPSGSGYGKGCRSTELTTVKIAALAPIPTASVKITIRKKPGERRRLRAVVRSDARTDSMQPLLAGQYDGRGKKVPRLFQVPWGVDSQ